MGMRLNSLPLLKPLALCQPACSATRRAGRRRAARIFLGRRRRRRTVINVSVIIYYAAAAGRRRRRRRRRGGGGGGAAPAARPIRPWPWSLHGYPAHPMAPSSPQHAHATGTRRFLACQHCLTAAVAKWTMHCYPGCWSWTWSS
jgi:hypothetical protein